jgi:GT2 family glycosyltransferase
VTTTAPAVSTPSLPGFELPLDAIDVSVLVVNYRTGPLVDRCLRSLAEQTTDLTVEVIVVDNDPDDARTLPDLLPVGRVLRMGDNTGFARAVNLAAAQARGRYILLLNPDTVVVDRAIEHLVAFADLHPGRGLYGGRTIDAEGRLDPRSCWAFPSLWSTACFAFGLSSLAKGNPILDPESMGRWRRDTVRPVDVVTGCLCLVPRGTWHELGGLDERFFVYGEDVDLALRAHAAGYRPVLCPSATVVHDVGASASRADKLVLLHRGKVTLLRKHWAPWKAAVGEALLQTGVRLRSAAGQPGWTELQRRRREWVDGHEGADS